MSNPSSSQRTISKPVQMDEKTFTAVYEQAENGCWSAHVVELPVILAVGNTLDSTEAHMQEAVRHGSKR